MTAIGTYRIYLISQIYMPKTAKEQQKKEGEQ